MTEPEPEFKPRFAAGTFSAALDILWSRGMRVGSAIDLGCADGHVGMLLYEAGFLRDCAILNVDANDAYRASLELIRNAIGAEFRFCAVTDRAGTVEFTRAAHPYWASTRPPDDPYWATVNDLSTDRVTVATRTLDDLVAELRMPPPFLLKLDIQGGELAALRGGPRTLAETDIIIIETAAEDFDPLYRFVSDAGFILFDIAYLQRRADQSFGWCYLICLHRRRADLIRHQVWPKAHDAAIIAAQQQRRTAVQGEVKAAIARMRAAGIISR